MAGRRANVSIKGEGKSYKSDMNKELIIPIYIDTNTLLDLLASIEDGFSLVEKITSREAHRKENERSIQGEGGTEFGIPNVLSLLKIRLGGSIGSRNSQERVSETQVERFHTYGSLLTRLREYLHENNMVSMSEGRMAVWWQEIQPSSFVELRGVFRPNPLADSLRTMGKVAALTSSMTSLAETSPRPRNQKGQQNPLEPVRKLTQDMLADIEKENIHLFVVDIIGEQPIRAVSLLQLDYLRDRSMTEIAHKEFTLLGKVVRKLDHNSEETVKLLRGTGIGSFGKNSLNSFLEVFKSMGEMEFPEVQVEISGPALEVVPIAIFV